MKKLLMSILVILTTLVCFISCSKDNESYVREEQSLLGKNAIDESIVGKFDEKGNFIFLKDKALLLKNWNYNLLTYYDIDAKLTSLDFFKDESGEVYLSAHGADYSSTAGITIIDDIYFQGEGITCTSNTCSGSSTECVPKADKKSCTKCGWGVGDCTKSVTAVAIFDKQLTPSDIL